MGFIKQFILPKAVDFDAALQDQARTIRLIVEDLHKACLESDTTALAAITTHADRARGLKAKNMKELLDVFITPYDKESIYRFITQLDWVALSVKHCKLETEAYGISSLQCYRSILQVLLQMAGLLEEGVKQLSTRQLKTITCTTDSIHDQYDQVVELCAKETAGLLRQDDCKRIIMHKDILAQLKEIAKRLHITANTLEDMAIKVV